MSVSSRNAGSLLLVVRALLVLVGGSTSEMSGFLIESVWCGDDGSSYLSMEFRAFSVLL